MALLLYVNFLLLLHIICSPSRGISQGPPSPGYYPSSHFKLVRFNQSFSNLWGPQHQLLDENGTYTIWLDKSSGSGFKSLKAYTSGYFGASIKLQPGYTAGVITCLYLSNNQVEKSHDEIDIEFLGTVPGEQYTLQTNIYVNGSGDGKNLVGREMRFHLWFDPTQDFHNYALLWSPDEIIFLVDDVPIRAYPRQQDDLFPTRPMWVYGSTWDASSWATDNGKYPADYRYQPFVSRYRNFTVSGCAADAPGTCEAPSASPLDCGCLTQRQYEAMDWVQKNNMVYYYCTDPWKDRTLTPECECS